MQPLTQAFPIRRSRWQPTAAGIGLSILLTAAGAPAASAACPWIVQPHADSDSVAFDIVFDGPAESAQVFYGFTVADIDLAWRLNEDGELPDLAPDARPLLSRQSAEGSAIYSLAPDTIEPHTLYLVAASDAVDKLDAVDARFEPSRPVAVSYIFRGASDMSGPLPHRSMPGVEIKSAESAGAGAVALDVAAATRDAVQICAYQVAMR